MVAYSIAYKIRGNEKMYDTSVDARDLKSAKRKIGKKHGYKDGRMIQLYRVSYIGFF